VRDIPFPSLADQLWTNSCQLFPALARIATGVAT
jgi:hypothetical protein